MKTTLAFASLTSRSTTAWIWLNSSSYITIPGLTIVSLRPNWLSAGRPGCLRQGRHAAGHKRRDPVKSPPDNSLNLHGFDHGLYHGWAQDVGPGSTAPRP